MTRKEQILEVATELIQTRGYTAFSYQDLSDRLGITKASIHHHFRSKEALGQAVATNYAATVKASLEKTEATTDDPWKQLDAYLRLVLNVIKRQDRVCPSCAVQSEINVVPQAVGEPICALSKFITRWISSVIERGRKAGVMDFPGKADDHAALITAATHGAMQCGRALGAKTARSIVQQIKRTLKTC